MYILVYTWSIFVCSVPLKASMLLTQIALEKELGKCIPAVFQASIKTILFNAVRVRWNNNNCVLHTQKQVHESIY